MRPIEALVGMRGAGQGETIEENGGGGKFKYVKTFINATMHYHPAQQLKKRT
jgi:hypothetical protein